MRFAAFLPTLLAGALGVPLGLQAQSSSIYNSTGDLGDLVVSMGQSVIIDTGLTPPVLAVDGATTHSGFVDTGVAGFHFRDVRVEPGATVEVRGDRPLVVAAQWDMVWGADVDVSGTVAGRAGGGVGGQGGAGGAASPGGSGGEGGDGIGGAVGSGGFGTADGAPGQPGTTEDGTDGLPGESRAGFVGEGGGFGFGNTSGAPGAAAGGTAAATAAAGNGTTGGTSGVGGSGGDQGTDNVIHDPEDEPNTPGEDGGAGESGGTAAFAEAGADGDNGAPGSAGGSANFPSPVNTLTIHAGNGGTGGGGGASGAAGAGGGGGGSAGAGGGGGGGGGDFFVFGLTLFESYRGGTGGMGASSFGGDGGDGGDGGEGGDGADGANGGGAVVLAARGLLRLTGEAALDIAPSTPGSPESGVAGGSGAVGGAGFASVPAIGTSGEFETSMPEAASAGDGGDGGNANPGARGGDGGDGGNGGNGGAGGFGTAGMVKLQGSVIEASTALVQATNPRGEPVPAAARGKLTLITNRQEADAIPMLDAAVDQAFVGNTTALTAEWFPQHSSRLAPLHPTLVNGPAIAGFVKPGGWTAVELPEPTPGGELVTIRAEDVFEGDWGVAYVINANSEEPTPTVRLVVDGVRVQTVATFLPGDVFAVVLPDSSVFATVRGELPPHPMQVAEGITTNVVHPESVGSNGAQDVADVITLVVFP